jgi:hypothetical protein
MWSISRFLALIADSGQASQTRTAARILSGDGRLSELRGSSLLQNGLGDVGSSEKIVSYCQWNYHRRIVGPFP